MRSKITFVKFDLFYFEEYLRNSRNIWVLYLNYTLCKLQYCEIQ